LVALGLSPWGRCCGLRAPQRCSCPVPLALSPAACLLCRRAEADPDICGDKREKHGLRAHVFCLYFASLLSQKDDNRTGLMGFRPRDIQLAVSRAAQKHCCVCGETGATIMCCQEDCDRWFHLPCAKHGACVTQYIAQYRYLLSPSGHPCRRTQHFSLCPFLFPQRLLP
uniref:PHD-type domain-containing protein n=1 Tax=Corvus moneduloides TaxID=1196302 RepID=A0A8C3E4S4_CORMO